MKPNILIIHCHDLGQHLGCYGKGVETPNIDSIYHQGVMFNNYCSTAPMCSPSRTSVMTGLYPINHGVMGQAYFGWKMRKGIKTLPMYLNETGYNTICIGFQHESVDPGLLGYKHFQHAFPNARGYAPDCAIRAIEFLDSFTPGDQPFYMNIGFEEVHRLAPVNGFKDFAGTESPPTFKPKYIAKDQQTGYTPLDCILRIEDPSMVNYFRNYQPEEVLPLPYLPDRPGIRKDIADVQAVITCVVDVMVGKIINKLAEKGLKENTLVIFSTDHGLDIPRAKGTLYDSGIKIALLMRCPLRFRHHKAQYDNLLSNADLMPTLLDFAGIKPPENIDGRSFLPLLEGTSYTGRDAVYAEMTWHGQYVPLRAIRTSRYKYIRNFHLQESSWVVSPESPAAREVVARFAGFRPIEELYDLEKDPQELNNLAPDRKMYSHYLKDIYKDSDWRRTLPEYENIRRDLCGQLRQHMMDTHDPLLNGPVPHPGYPLIWDKL